MGCCHGCGRRVQGRHPLQSSDAVGGVQLGPEALALAAILNKQMGLSLGHTRQVLAYGFGLQVSCSGLYRALARMSRRAAPTYAGLVKATRQALVNVPDETGWRVGGHLQWMHVTVSAQVTVYAILPGRGYERRAMPGARPPRPRADPVHALFLVKSPAWPAASTYGDSYAAVVTVSDN